MSGYFHYPVIFIIRFRLRLGPIVDRYLTYQVDIFCWQHDARH